MAACMTCGKWYEKPPNGGHKYCSPACHFRKFAKIGDGCWPWGGNHNAHGYGFLVIGGRGKRVLAHRFSYEMHKGLIPTGLFVLHACDNPPCVNPAHLFLGTHKDNTRDSMEKGRHSPPPRSPDHFSNTEKWKRGEEHYCAKLTENEVKSIRISAEGPRALARHFGVSKSLIYAIKKRTVWKHVI